LKLALKGLTPKERMHKDKEIRELRQQFNSLKAKEETMMARLDPLQEAVMIVTQVVEKNKAKIVEWLEVEEGQLK